MKFLHKKKKAFTLMEAVLAMFIVSIIVIVMYATLKPSTIKADALKVSGVNGYNILSGATKTILINHSSSYNMETLKNISGTAFSLSDSNKNEYISALYQKYLGKRSDTADSTYLNIPLKNEAGTQAGSLSVSSFSNGIFIKNKTYVAFKLNSNCTTTETNTIFDPSVPDKHTLTNSCGLILFDVNGKEQPNLLGIDMYIVSIGKYGIK